MSERYFTKRSIVGLVLAGMMGWYSSNSYAGTIGVGPVFDQSPVITDGVKLRYHARVNKLTADSLKLVFQTRRLYNPSCVGADCQTYLLESNLYSYGVSYSDTGCVPWPPSNAGTTEFRKATLWLSIPDYNQKGLVGSRPVNMASEQMFPRVMTGIDNITGLTKIETISQMDIAGQDMTIEYARGGTFTAPLSGWGWRFDPTKTVTSGQPPCVADLPAGEVYRIWTASITIGGQAYAYEFAVPDRFATNFAPSEIFSIVTEFLDKTPEEISAGNGDFQAYFWDFELQRENTTTWIPLRRMQVFYRADLTENIGWGAKIGQYQGHPVLEISNDTTDTYFKLNEIFEIPTSYSLTLLKSGNGIVQSFPAGINCGGTCMANFVNGAQVTLQATPDSGFVFGGWDAVCASTTSSCIVTLDGNKTISAHFEKLSSALYPLALNTAGNGSGRVSGSGQFVVGTTVTLTAKSEKGSVFSGWSPSPCATVFTMPSNALTCTATFIESPKNHCGHSNHRGGHCKGHLHGRPWQSTGHKKDHGH